MYIYTHSNIFIYYAKITNWQPTVEAPKKKKKTFCSGSMKRNRWDISQRSFSQLSYLGNRVENADKNFWFVFN